MNGASEQSKRNKVLRNEWNERCERTNVAGDRVAHLKRDLLRLETCPQSSPSKKDDGDDGNNKIIKRAFFSRTLKSDEM